MLTLSLLASSVALAEPSPADAAARALEGLSLSHTVTVQSTGQGPKQKVRMKPEAGTVAAYDLITEQDMALSMQGPDGQLIPMDGMGNLAPTMVFSVKHQVHEPVAQGLVPVQVEYTDVAVRDVPPELAQQMMQGLAPMKGLSFRLLVDPEAGKAVQADVSVEDQAMYEMTQALADQFVTSMPSFPTEPIGVGAVWTVDLTMNVSGMSLLTKQKVTVTELSDDHIATKVSFEMAKGDSPMALPGLPPGASVDLSRFEGSGQGELRTDLRSMVSTGSIETIIDLQMSVGMGEEGAMGMGMRSTQTMTMKAR